MREGEERRRKLLDCLQAVSMFPCEILWVQSTLVGRGSFSSLEQGCGQASSLSELHLKRSRYRRGKGKETRQCRLNDDLGTDEYKALGNVEIAARGIETLPSAVL